MATPTSLERLLAEDGLLAAVVGRPRLGRRGRVPAGWSAVALADGPPDDQPPAAPPVASAGQAIPPSPAAVLFVRGGTWAVPLSDIALQTSDRLSSAVSLTVQLRPVVNAVELAGLRSAVLGPRLFLRVEHVAEQIRDAVAAALASLATEIPVAELVERVGPDRAAAAISARLREWLFRGGLELAGVAGWTVASSDYRRRRRVEREAALAEDIAHMETRLADLRQQNRSADFDRLADILPRLAELAGAIGDATPAQRATQLGLLLAQFTPADREAFSAAGLRLAGPAGKILDCPTILVAAGAGLFLLGPQTDSPAPVAGSEELAGRIGPVRSLSTGQDGLLLAGGRDGVALLRVAAKEPGLRVESAWALPPSAKRRRGGVNASAVCEGSGTLWATHSEIGLLRWRLDQPGGPGEVVLPAGGRPVRAVGPGPAGRWLLAAGPDVLTFDPTPADTLASATLLSAPANVAAIAADGPAAWAGCEDGRLFRIDLAGRAAEVARFPAPVGSIQAAIIGLLPRLLLATGGGCTLWSESLGSAVALGGVRAARVARSLDGWTVAVAPRRDTLFAWSPCEPDRPARRIDVSLAVGHLIQDIRLLEA